MADQSIQTSFRQCVFCLVDVNPKSETCGNNLLWVNTWNEGMTRVFGVSDPFNPTVIYDKTIGQQINMLSQSWDGTRVYFTSSLLGNWDKQSGDTDDLQYFKAYHWDGKELAFDFELDFLETNLGYPHQMRVGSYCL